jgi:hypothetical protein
VQVISNPDKNNELKQIRIEKRRPGENRFYIHADVRLAVEEARQVRRRRWLPRSQAAPGRGGGGALQSECGRVGVHGGRWPGHGEEAAVWAWVQWGSMGTTQMWWVRVVWRELTGLTQIRGRFLPLTVYAVQIAL